MKYYLSLRLRILTRWCTDSGFSPWLIALVFTGVFIGASMAFCTKVPHPHISYPILSAVLLVPLSARQRNEPLLLLFNRTQFFQLRLLENTLLSIPFALVMLWKGFALWSLLPILFALPLALLLWRTGAGNALPTPCSASAPEFIIGYRKTRWVLLMLYGLFGMGWAVGNINLALVSIALIGLVAAGFYAYADDPFFVWQHQHPPAAFLLHKMKYAIFYSLALLLLPWLLMLLWAPQEWPLLLGLLVFVPAYVSLAVLSRYMLFPQDAGVAQALLLGLCVVLPFFLPILLPYCFFKAQQRMQFILS